MIAFGYRTANGWILVVLAALAFSHAQTAKPSHPPTPTGAVRGHVYDSRGEPAADAIVLLQHQTEIPGAGGTPTQALETQRVHSSGQGAYSFSNLPEGSYTLRAERASNERSAPIQVELGRNETKTIDLAFAGPEASGLPDQE